MKKTKIEKTNIVKNKIKSAQFYGKVVRNHCYLLFKQAPCAFLLGMQRSLEGGVSHACVSPGLQVNKAWL